MDSRYKVGETVTGITGDYICHGVVVDIVPISSEEAGTDLPTFEYHVQVLDTEPPQTRVFLQKELKDYL